MKSELGQMMYVTEGGELYLMVDGSVYGIDLSTLEMKELIKGLDKEIYAVSESDRYFAWTKDSQNGQSDTISLINFSSEKTFTITEGSGKYVKPLGFMGDDFVYGVANAADVSTEAAGNVIFPMYQIKILDVSSDTPSVLKTYEKNGYYVSGVDIEDYTMYLNRIQYNGTAYVDADQDMIMNREGDGNKIVSIVSSSSDSKETRFEISLPENVGEKAPRLLTPRETILEQDRTLTLEDKGGNGKYYVYVKGDVVYTTDQVADAITKANEKMGVVVGEDQEYIWKRSRDAIKPALSDIAVGAEDASSGSIAQCINAMLEKEGINISVSALIAGGETPKNILSNTMKDARILDLTGCSVEEVLYYVSCGNPVFAMTGSNEAVLVVGYDANNVIIFDSSSGNNFKQSITEADEVFKGAGNVFFTYLK